ncbi:peptidylprolyl isomerase [Flavobacterium sp.]|uniref:peptidylprolyl isomerase n=1 Tax=Flavobacterium sp. TaxID=239 RepID=UPI003528BD5B
MAILGKIRQKSGLLIFMIALALVIFIVQAALENGFFGSNAQTAGSINGTDIQAQEFMRKVAQMEQQNQNISNTQAMNSVWEQEVRNIIIGEETEKLGLGLGNEQIINEIKKNQYFSQNPQFLNEAGSFDEGKFKEWVKSIQNDPNQERWTQWKQFENETVNSTVQQLFFNMVKGGVYTTKAEGQFKYAAENRKVDFNYVTVPYSTINDDEVKVSDDEILSYMKKHPKKYKSESTRSLEYVFFANTPSEKDSKDREVEMNKVLNGSVEFNSTTNTNDTIPGFKNIASNNIAEFINKNSDIKFDSTYLAKKDLPKDFQEQLFNLSIGEIYGPYEFNGHQCVSKMLDKKANGSVKAAHILISYAGAPSSQATRTKEEAQTKANELLAQAKANPANFAALAAANSEDPGSKNNGGEYDNIAPGQMVPEFNDFIFNNPIGAIGLVETTYGFHIIKVNDKYSAVLLGTVAQSIEASEETIDANYTKSSKFLTDANSKDFAEVAKTYEATVMPANGIQATDEQVASLGAQREIVQWAFNKDTEKGNVARFDTPKGYVVAKLTDINETGLLAIDMARDVVGATLKNEKKAAKIRERMKGATLEEVAKATGGSVMTANDATLVNATIPNVGRELKVVGTAFATPANKVSGLIDGTTGVFMIKTVAVKPETKLTSYATQINAENQQQQNSAQSRVYQALKDNSKIERQ